MLLIFSVWCLPISFLHVLSNFSVKTLQFSSSFIFDCFTVKFLYVFCIVELFFAKFVLVLTTITIYRVHQCQFRLLLFFRCICNSVFNTTFVFF